MYALLEAKIALSSHATVVKRSDGRTEHFDALECSNRKCSACWEVLDIAGWCWHQFSTLGGANHSLVSFDLLGELRAAIDRQLLGHAPCQSHGHEVPATTIAVSIATWVQARHLGTGRIWMDSE